jgi:hypothetical protein
MFDGTLHMVILALIQCSKITKPTLKWSETRRDALKALSSICCTVCGESDWSPGNSEFPQLRGLTSVTVVPDIGDTVDCH